ncbi:MAG: hypothetical protein ABI446_05550 [Gemmatimonadaceae bacterium]
MHRAAMFLAATMAPLTDSAFTLQADLIAQDVAAEVRQELGAHGQDAPLADGKIAWQTAGEPPLAASHPNG